MVAQWLEVEVEGAQITQERLLRIPFDEHGRVRLALTEAVFADETLLRDQLLRLAHAHEGPSRAIEDHERRRVERPALAHLTP